MHFSVAFLLFAPLRTDEIPTNTMSPELSLTALPSGIFIHPAVWSQRKIGDVFPFWGGTGSPSNTNIRLG